MSSVLYTLRIVNVDPSLFNVITDLTSLQGLEMNGAAPSGHIAKEVFK